MEKMLVTQALDERDLLKKRIHDAIRRCRVVTTKLPNDSKVAGGMTVEEFNQEATSQLQRVTDLIDRYKRLDSAILLANATEMIEVAGKKMPRAMAINLRKSLLSSQRGVDSTDFEGMLISQLEVTLNDAKTTIAKTQMFADRQKEVLMANITSSEKKDVTSDAVSNLESYCANLVGVLVDPVGAEKKLQQLIEERDALISNLETAIKISNATTYVEF